MTNGWQSECKKIFVIVGLVLLLELTVFNYKFYSTLGNQPFQVNQYTVSEALHKADDNGNYDVWSNEDVTINIADMSMKVNSIQMKTYNVVEDAQFTEHADIEKKKLEKIKVELYGNDMANQNMMRLGSRCVVSSVEQSQYAMIHLAPGTTEIQLKLLDLTNPKLCIEKLVVNPHIPFHFSIFRVFLFGLLAILIFLFRPASYLYRLPYDEHAIWKKAADLGYVGFCIILFFLLVHMNPIFDTPITPENFQYQQLAQSLKAGVPYLQSVPDQTLLTLPNPYDMQQRIQNGIPYLWDTALYNGHYYVYFGIIPVLLYYLPGLLIFGRDLSTNTGIYLTGIVGIIGLLKLLNLVVKRRFSKISYGVYALLVLSATMGSGFWYIMIRPDFYSFPILMGITFSLWGLYFWISAKENMDSIDNNDSQLCKWRLAAGSLCMALVAGCRPQLVIMSFLALLIFREEICKQRKLVLGNLKNTIAFLIPYIMVAAGLMYYNAIRFGSVFDFGANYNLTTNDMRYRGMNLGRVFSGLYVYLFQLPDTCLKFPFIRPRGVDSPYLGTVISEELFGGLFVCNGILLLLLFAYRFRRLLKQEQVYGVIYATCLFGLMVILADTQMAGMLPRYFNDFAWMFYMAVICMVCSLEQYAGKLREYRITYLWRMFLMVTFAQSLLYHIARLFTDTMDALNVYAPDVFYKAAHDIAFWL